MVERYQYLRRLIDDDLDEFLAGLAAVAIEGPRGVGKTATGIERARTVLRLDDPHVRSQIELDRAVLLKAATPVLIDEWQQMPYVWDLVRRAVDDHAPPGSFLLAGSAFPIPGPAHSGAGRIVSLRMRPLSLHERQVADPVVSLRSIVAGERPSPTSTASPISLPGYVDEILDSGFPGIRALPARLRAAELDAYVARIVERDFRDLGLTLRRPAALTRWLRAYAAATATCSSWQKIRRAAASVDGEVPAKETAMSHRDALARLWLLDPLEPWIPTDNPLGRLALPEKHHLADPALAARLMGFDRSSWDSGVQLGALGRLFESLATLSVRTYAASFDARVEHLRTARGDREIDLIVHGRAGGVVAIEVKLGASVDDSDVRHLEWLRQRLGDRLIDAVVITAGQLTYRRPDGVLVVPLALLGP
jgi:predicted AAA+ superfamily ATPase